MVGNIGSTGNYSNLAISEGHQANLCRNITLGLFGIGIALAGGTLVVHIYEEFTNTEYKPDTLSLLLRFLVALVIALPAFYTARESARHRTNSDRSKQTELELATLEPFMEFLPLDQKHAIKAKLTDRYFGNQVDAHKFDAPLDASDAVKLVAAINELVKKLKE